MKKVDFLHIHLGCLGQFRKGVVALKLLLLDVQTTSVLETASNNYKKESRNQISHQYTLFKIFIFCPKVQLWYPEKISDFLGWKIRDNVEVLDFLAVARFGFRRKYVKNNFGWKTCKNVGVLSKLNFWTKNQLLE